MASIETISCGVWNSNIGEKLYLEVTEQSTNTANNTSTLKWIARVYYLNTNTRFSGTTRSDAGSFSFVVNGQTVASGTQSINNGTTYDGRLTFEQSGTLTVTHNNDGSKAISFSINCSRGGGNFSGDPYVLGGASNSGSLTLTKLPRQATLSGAPNFNDEQNPTITYSSPAGNSVTSLQACISLDNNTANIAYRDVSKTGSSYTFNLTDAERNVLRNACTTANSRTVYFKLKTVIGSVTYYSNLSKTLTIVNATPTLGTLSYSDMNTVTRRITGDATKIIQGQSNLMVTVDTASALKSATLSKAVVKINNKEVQSKVAGYNASNIFLEIGTINSSSNVTATVTITDSRGNAASKQIAINVLPYSAPINTVSLQRKNNYYDETYLMVSSEYSSIDDKNELEITYEIVEGTVGNANTDAQFSSPEVIENNVRKTLNLNNEKKYTVRITIKDKISTVVIYKYLDAGVPILFINTLHNSIGINCFANKDNTLMLNGSEVTPMTFVMDVTTNANGEYVTYVDVTSMIFFNAVATRVSDGATIIPTLCAMTSAIGTQVWKVIFKDISGNLVKNTQLKVVLYSMNTFSVENL